MMERSPWLEHRKPMASEGSMAAIGMSRTAPQKYVDTAAGRGSTGCVSCGSRYKSRSSWWPMK